LINKTKVNNWGKKLPMKDPLEILRNVENALNELKGVNSISFDNLKDLKSYFLEISRVYYALAAMSRRKVLEKTIRDNAYDRLFPFRSLLEKRIHDSLNLHPSPLHLIKIITSKSFFGGSIKQGVSIRYPLSTCIPTQTCGGRCYAHDGRDRDYDRLFRGVLNGFVGIYYESNFSERGAILKLLNSEINLAIKISKEEAELAQQEGYTRKPRIRFSHVGELAATPNFTNDLATEIKKRAPEVSCVIYTRHPKANNLDGNLFVVNFTVEGPTDKRINYMPSKARLVSSSWDGGIFDKAEINFLEHHVEKIHVAQKEGNICPVTLNHKITTTCDSARCQKCFVAKLD